LLAYMGVTKKGKRIVCNTEGKSDRIYTKMGCDAFGTIHLRCREIFTIFEPYSPLSAVFYY
jgi:hypothetical protein